MTSPGSSSGGGRGWAIPLIVAIIGAVAVIVAAIIQTSRTSEPPTIPPGGRPSFPSESSASPNSTPTVTTPPTPPTTSPPSNGYRVAYQKKTLIMQLGSQQGPINTCSLGQFKFVDVDVPKVDIDNQPGKDDLGFSCNGIIYYVIPYNGELASLHEQGDPNSCINAINSSPITSLTNIKPGDGFCLKVSSGLVAYVRVVDIVTPGSVTLRLDAWTQS